MSEEEISEQYKNGLVDLMNIVEPLIENFKTDKTSVDIQQLQLITTYLIAEREMDENYIDELEDELNKEKEKNKEQLEAITEWVNGERINDIKHISKDKIKEKLLEPIRKEAEEINKKFFEKDTGFEIEGAILQELGAIEGMILELLEE